MFSNSDNFKKALWGTAAVAALALARYALKSTDQSPQEGEQKSVTKDDCVALIGDVGGTNVRLQLVRLCLKTRTSTVIKALTKIPSQQVNSFDEAVSSFLKVSHHSFVKSLTCLWVGI